MAAAHKERDSLPSVSSVQFRLTGAIRIGPETEAGRNNKESVGELLSKRNWKVSLFPSGTDGQ